MSVTPRRPLQEVLDEFGPLKDGSTVSASEAEVYRGRLPDAMVDFWIEHGRGQWRDGLYWICDPEPIIPVLHTLLPAIWNSTPREWCPSCVMHSAKSASGTQSLS